MSVTSPQSVGTQTGSIAGRAVKTKRGLWDALPAFMVAQGFVIYTVVTNQAYWLKIANAILR